MIQHLYKQWFHVCVIIAWKISCCRSHCTILKDCTHSQDRSYESFLFPPNITYYTCFLLMQLKKVFLHLAAILYFSKID